MRRVLIVDDEVLVRIGIKHSIAWEQNGFELIGEASDGKEALEMIQKLAPDIVILDINMPVLNGIEVLRELKEQKYKGKVIVLTCFNEIEYARSAMKYAISSRKRLCRYEKALHVQRSAYRGQDKKYQSSSQGIENLFSGIHGRIWENRWSIHSVSTESDSNPIRNQSTGSRRPEKYLA